MVIAIRKSFVDMLMLKLVDIEEPYHMAPRQRVPFLAASVASPSTPRSAGRSQGRQHRLVQADDET